MVINSENNKEFISFNDDVYTFFCGVNFWVKRKCGLYKLRYFFLLVTSQCLTNGTFGW